jgi:hypothetical protein
MKARWEWLTGEKLTFEVKADDSGFVLSLHYRVPSELKARDVDGL